MDFSFIDFNKNYYEILGVNEAELPKGKDAGSKKRLRNLLQTAYRKKIFEVHPDRPDGDEETFKDVVQAHTILSDPLLRKIYEDKDFSKVNGIKGEKVAIEWSRIGTYRKGSLADTIGNTLFEKIVQESNIDGLTVKFIPASEEDHNYDWEFTIPGLKKEMVLSIVDDEEEVLRLTNGNISQIDSALPFKIYICFPGVEMVFIRGDDVAVENEYGFSDMIKGRINNAKFLDADLLSTTNYDYACDYITSGQLKNSVEECINGNIEAFISKKFIKKADNAELSKIKEVQDINKMDQVRLKELLKISKVKRGMVE